jgi:hypothetical protein
MAEIYYCVAFSAVAASGLVMALRENALEVLPLALCVAIHPMPFYLTRTSLRYRHPIDPVLTLFAVFAAAQIWSVLCSMLSRVPKAEIEIPDDIRMSKFLSE